MKITGKIHITHRHLVDELPSAWTQEDYINILELTGFSDKLEDSEIKGMMHMALADQEPEESAEMILTYRMSEDLAEGQIKQLSHEMQADKIPEEYPDMALQHELYNVNQLLFKAYNGKFPNCKAVEADIDLHLEHSAEATDEVILRALAPALGSHSVIARLYEEELKGEKPFNDAGKILWKTEVKSKGEGNYTVKVFSSEYWLHDLPMNSDEYNFSLEMFEEEEED